MNSIVRTHSLERDERNAQAYSVGGTSPGVFVRWGIMLATSLLCFSSYFVYESISPLAGAIKEQIHISNMQYGLLFSFLSIPNVIFFVVIIVGVIVDRLGTKASGNLFATLCLAGAVLTAVGASSALPSILGSLFPWVDAGFAPEYNAALKVMLLGRLVYGFGAHAIVLVNHIVLARWFKGRELALAFGLSLAIMRLGTFFALNVQPRLAEAFGLSTALWFAAALMLAGFGAFWVSSRVESLARNRLHSTASSQERPRRAFSVRDIFNFDKSLWCLVLLCVTFYCAVFPFQGYASDILVQKFGIAPLRAGSYASALVLCTMVLTPVFGWIVDRKGCRISLMMCGLILLIPSYLALAFTQIQPLVPLVLVGVSMSLVPAALWPSIPLIVDEDRLGTALGIVGYCQSLGLIVFFWLAGKIADFNTSSITVNDRIVSRTDYAPTILLFAGIAMFGVAFSILLKRADARRTDGRSIDHAPVESPSGLVHRFVHHRTDV